MKTDKKRLLGIDPGFNNFGLAIWDPGKRTLLPFSGRFDQSIEFIREDENRDDLVAIMEDPNLDSVVFDTWKDIKKEIAYLAAITAPAQRSKQWERIESIYRRQLKIAQSVGENKAAAKRIVTYLSHWQIPIVLIAPSERNRVDKLDANKRKLPIQYWSMPTKTNKAQFEALTGYTGVTTEHSRDASTLVYGRNINWALTLYAKQNGGEFF